MPTSPSPAQPLSSNVSNTLSIVEFVKSFPLQTFSKNEALFDADQPSDNILIVREGAVKVSSFSDDGTERILWLAGRYDIVPTEGLFSRSSAPRYFYTAFSDGSAYAVNKKEFLAVAATNVAIMTQLARGLSEHHDDLLVRLHSVGQPNLRSKTLAMLHALCEKFSGADVVHFHELGLNLTHQDIAGMVDATREAVSIELKQLQDEGFVDYSRSTFTVNYQKIDHEIKTSA